MFRNIQAYRLPAPWAMTADALAAALASQSFTPCASNDLLREGWDTIRDERLVYAVNGQFLLKLTSESKVLPAAVINQVTKARAAEMEEAQGFAPGKKAVKELRERVADELLPRAFAKRDSMWVWIDPLNGWLVVDTASPSKADAAIKLLLKAVDRLPLESLRVQRSPVGAMTEWLQSDEAPASFTVDMDATLRATGESKASIQYKRHTLGGAEVAQHIKDGKQCVRLAMTWNSKISFVLDESLTVKSLKLLDVLTEKAVTLADAEKFDSEFALFAGEAAKLLADLVDALGGAAEGEAPVTRPAESDGPAKGDEAVRAQRVVAQVVDIPDGSASDPLYEKAVLVVRTNRRASISLVQRHLVIGYNRAARLMDAMESAGVISAMASNGDRTVLGP